MTYAQDASLLIYYILYIYTLLGLYFIPTHVTCKYITLIIIMCCAGKALAVRTPEATYQLN